MLKPCQQVVASVSCHHRSGDGHGVLGRLQHAGDKAAKRPRHEKGVGVHGGHNGRGHSTKVAVQRLRFATMVGAHELHPAVAGGDLTHDLPGAVGGAVVDHGHHEPAGVVLAQGVFERLANARLFVIGGHEQRDVG